MDDAHFSELVESVKDGGEILKESISISYLVSKRGSSCEWCGIHKATERHHCLIHKMKGHPELDDERNLMLVCHECHESGMLNNRVAREWFWMRQSGIYPDLITWYNGLDLKVKELFE